MIKGEDDPERRCPVHRPGIALTQVATEGHPRRVCPFYVANPQNFVKYFSEKT